ncbi:hypothetical protein FJY63_10400 [Candidatus Sumerlaeota bacterium]|nr:hypothetical protein [Candidatus Sumerlaeota bacterium]
MRHWYYQTLLQDYYESRGFTAQVEARVADTTFDLLVIDKLANRLAIEIATSLPYEEINAQKAIASGVERVLFVCEAELMEPLQRKIAAAIEGRPGPRPGFKLIDDYLLNGKE